MKSMAILKSANLMPMHGQKCGSKARAGCVDLTAAVAPERVMQNLNQAIPKRGFAGLMNFALSGIHGASYAHAPRRYQ
jgi:hypothetical protein